MDGLRQWPPSPGQNEMRSLRWFVSIVASVLPPATIDSGFPTPTGSGPEE
jgi:hypothetical protein